MCNDINCNGVPYGMQVSGPGDGQIIIGCCKIQEGYYCVWDLKHMGMVCEEWAEVCDLRKTLHSVRHISFNVVQERQRARTALNNLAKDAPFNECKRFPWRRVYVNLSCGVYGNLWENILSALDFKDREAEKEMKYRKTQPSDEDHHMRNEYTLDDAKTQFRNTLKQMNNELCKRTEMFDRLTFEREYDLRWCIGKCPTDPGLGQLPPNEPDKPDDGRPKYGDIIKKLKDLKLDPQDFSVFGPVDMKRNDFACNRTLQELGAGLEKTRLPNDVKIVFVMTSGEYSKCSTDGEKVMGYTYNVETGEFSGPKDLKAVSLDEELEFEDFVNSLDLSSLVRNLYMTKKTEKKYPKSVLPGSKSYAEALCSTSKAQFSRDKGKSKDFSSRISSSGEDNDYDESRVEEK